MRIRACAERRWSLYLFHRETFKRFAVPYRCNSWRHAGECARANSHAIFARMAGPLQAVNPRHVLMVVLTLDRDEVARCAAAAGQRDARYFAFRSLQRRWQSLRQALHRHADRMGARRMRWAMTVESHRRGGWPHAHLIVEWPWLAEALVSDDHAHDCGRTRHADGTPGAPQHRCGARGCLVDWLSDHAVACGFGRVVSVEVARSKEQAAGYIVKLTGEQSHGKGVHAGAAAGEVAKTSQLPLDAPPRFRRIRYSLRSQRLDLAPMLDPVRHDPAIAGAMCNQPAELVEAAIADGRDLVQVVDDDGVVTRVPFLVARPGLPPDDWLDRRLLPFLMDLWVRLYGLPE